MLIDISHERVWAEDVREIEQLTEENKALKDRLEEAKKAMVELHCSTFETFPDEEHCGSPKTRTCHQYYLCEAMKRVLCGGGCGGAGVKEDKKK
jgi:hypothetical protein